MPATKRLRNIAAIRFRKFTSKSDHTEVGCHSVIFLKSNQWIFPDLRLVLMGNF
jgi:hypothetical protein